MFVPFFDINYLIFSLPAILIGGLASLLLRYWSSKYLSKANINHLTGIDIVERYAQKKGLNVRLSLSQGYLSDFYDPTNQIINLSNDIARTASITAISVAAHEMGHAEQHQHGSVFMRVRNLLLPALNIGTSLGYLLLVAGIIIGLTQLAWLGIILFSGTTVFSLLTLPIEIDASRRGLNFLRSEQLLYPDEIPHAQKVLSAAALTYVAATLQSLGSLLYFIFRVQGISSKD